MSNHRSSRRVVPLVLGLVLTTLLSGCGLWPQPHVVSAVRGQLPTTAPGVKVRGKTVEPFDIRPLLHPRGKYLGVALPGIVGSTKPITGFGTKVGKRPNLVEFYSAWGDQYEAATVRANWDLGVLSNIALEPNKAHDVADIIAGKDDDYIGRYASEIRVLNLPVAISFGHEMNGDWRPWGSTHITPGQFVAAWRHIHDVFVQNGATSVIWVWSPNATGIISPPNPLKNYWPGDAYVDWLGVIGYFGQAQRSTFSALFDDTFSEIRTFTRKPFLISETAAGPGSQKAAQITSLFTAVAKRSDVIGFNWFNYYKAGQKDETNWQVDSSQSALAAFRTGSAGPRFGFDVKHP